MSSIASRGERSGCSAEAVANVAGVKSVGSAAFDGTPRPAMIAIRRRDDEESGRSMTMPKPEDGRK
ncbi:MAG: hypothetical protein QM775_03900 [Pirellulales bacterium]